MLAPPYVAFPLANGYELLSFPELSGGRKLEICGPNLPGCFRVEGVRVMDRPAQGRCIVFDLGYGREALLHGSALTHEMEQATLEFVRQNAPYLLRGAEAAVPAAAPECPECWGTKYYRGYGAPCRSCR